jgi:hypothetical protein
VDCQSLTSIELSESAIGDEALVGIGKLPKLEDLNLLRTKITPSGIGSLTKLPLKKLNLDDIAAMDDSAIESIKRFEGLEFLHLGKTKVTDKGVLELQTMSKLKDLLLNDTSVSEAAINELSKKLPGLKVRLK